MLLDDSITISNKYFLYKYVGQNKFLLNRNRNFKNENYNEIVLKENIKFLTLFAQNNNLASFYQVEGLLFIYREDKIIKLINIKVKVNS